MLEKDEWQLEWPKENGPFWFYGWLFRGQDKDEKPEICLVDVGESGVKGVFMYVTQGHFLYREEGAIGLWQKVILPALPTLEDVR